MLSGSFLAYLVDQSIKETKRYRQYSNYEYNDNRSKAIIPWIETLLQTPLADHRKYCIWRILTPYLVNIRRLGYDGSLEIISDWLNECYKLERLNFDAKTKIKEAFKRVGTYDPISLDNLKTKNTGLYELTKTKHEKYN